MAEHQDLVVQIEPISGSFDIQHDKKLDENGDEIMHCRSTVLSGLMQCAMK